MSEESSGAVSETTSDERTLALLAHVGGIIAGPFVALIIWLIKREDSDFLDDQAKEALNFQITVIIASVINIVLVFLIIGILTAFLIGIADFVFCIIAALKAFGGERYRYPLTLRLIP